MTCNAQVGEGHTVSVLYGADYHPDMLQAFDTAIQLFRIPHLHRAIRPREDLRAYRQLVQHLQHLRPDVVHTHQSKAGILGRLAAARAGVPCIVHGVHISPFRQVGLHQRLIYLGLERTAGRVTDAFIHVNDDLKQEYLAANIGHSGSHHVVESGMDVMRFLQARERADWREVLADFRIGIPDPQFLLMIASLEPRKRHREFLPVFRRVVQACPRAVLLLAGDGESRLAIERQVNQLNLQSHVVMLGFHPAPEQLISIADVCLLTSCREGLPRVVIQYLLGGRPVVATDLPGLRDLITPGPAGYLVPIDQLHQMEGPLVRLLTDEQERQRLTANAQQVDLTAWDQESMVRRIRRIYQQLVPSPQPVLTETGV